MKIYRIVFNNWDYDQYDAFVVIAKDGKSAISLLKNEFSEINDNVDWKGGYKIKEIRLNKLKKETVLLASFNAG